MRRRLAQLLFAIVVAIPLAASAHRLGESYVYFDIGADRVAGRFEMPLADLDRLAGLDTDGDGTVSAAELAAPRAFAALAPRLSLGADGATLGIVPSESRLLGTALGDFAQVGFTVTGLGRVPETLLVDYRPPAEEVPGSDLGLVLIERNIRTGVEGNEGYVSLVFAPGGGLQALSLTGEPLGKTLRDYLIYGIRHAWQGLDRLILIAALLLPAVLAADGRRAESDFTTAFWRVTAPLALAALAATASSLAVLFLGLPVPVILLQGLAALALAALIAAVFDPGLRRVARPAAALYGIGHGAGLAGLAVPLGTLALPRLTGMAGFGAGLLAGLVGLAALALPLAWLLRRSRLYTPVALRAAPLALLALGLLWFAEAVTDFEWNMRATLAALSGGA